jgi:hypothetical protein
MKKTNLILISVGCLLSAGSLRAASLTLAWGSNPESEARMHRRDCLAWMKRKGFPQPPRSACVYCPFHSDEEWRRLKTDDPEAFNHAVEFEKKLQAIKRETDNMKGVPFLHTNLKPLSEVDFSKPDYEQVNLFGNECEGMCGV